MKACNAMSKAESKAVSKDSVQKSPDLYFARDRFVFSIEKYCKIYINSRVTMIGEELSTMLQAVSVTA